MKPIKFDQVNKTYAENQPPYLPLPVYEDSEQGGRVVCCWELTIKERIKLLFTGKIWNWVLNFGTPLQPHALDVTSPFKSESK